MYRIIIFAKAPVPGRCKSRLAVGLGARRAAAVYCSLLARTVAEAVAADVAPVAVWCSPDTRHPFFTRLRREYGVTLHCQPRGDLGRRMHGAFRAALSEAPGAVMIGGDCPVLSGAHLRAALAALDDGAAAVFAPAEDGGYALAGLREPHAGLFRGMPWGGPRVMAQTRRRAAALGLRVVYLPMLWDVDTMADYRRMIRRMIRRTV
jgi:hypothetical protein